MGKKIYTAIGLMSGTALDGIDAAVVRTDGANHVEFLDFITIPYDDSLREALRACLGRREDVDGFVGRTENEMTRAHAAAVDWLLSQADLSPGDVDLIGFHGQTLFHDPSQHFTWQIGNGAMLARLTGIDVVNDFRSADVAAGGEGAPLMPLYHQARAAAVTKPVAILNIGGVANVTYLGRHDEVIAFDTGPGNALLNDWVKKHINRDYDENGLIARQGTIREDIVERWLSHSYFERGAPKSLDRDAWDISALEGVSLEDGAATLTAFTVRAVAKGRDHLPGDPRKWYVTGGGRHNVLMMEMLQDTLAVPVQSVDALGWHGDALEAKGFAWLAVRSVLGLPLALPSMTGGVLHKADQKRWA